MRPRPIVLAIAAGLLAGGGAAFWLRSPAAKPAVDLGPVRRGTIEGEDVGRTNVPVSLVPIAGDVGQPTDLAFVPGHPTKLVVSSKWGSLHLVDLDAETTTPWLWIPVLDALECGVLGFAFDPAFERTGRFWVHRCPESADGEVTTALSEARVDPGTLVGPRLVGDVLAVPQPHATHNAGQIAFGPDGMLYLALGDDWAGNPERRSQDRTNLLGSLVRVDVSAEASYAVPPDNPFVGQANVRPEIWAYGFRNPWRFTFDTSGRLIVADVGQSRWEEVDVVEAGENFGWPDREGFECYGGPEECPAGVDPVHVYGRMAGVSITGGVEWTAPGVLKDTYVFGDFGTGRLWAIRLGDGRGPIEDVTALGRFPVSPSAFARGPEGRVYLADFRSDRIYRVEPAL
ncbi:MAG: PQQ-dependent sugar dehydrogenase [Myxococcota bacterium]